MTYGIALGSNLGDRLRNLQSAVGELCREESGVRLRAAAPVYETEPVDCPEGSQNFFNTVIEVESEVSPTELLRVLHAIETGLGRSNVHGHHAPRTVDLDILYADQAVLQDASLVLPHPRLQVRRFVLQPLADIRPGLVLPGQSQSVAGLLAALDSPEAPLRIVVRDWVPPA